MKNPIKIKITGPENIRVITSEANQSLWNILNQNGYNIYAPCGGKGTCGKCLVTVTDEGPVLSCTYYPDKNIEIILPGKEEANILISQTEFLEDLPLNSNKTNHVSANPYGAAIDIGTTTVVIYFIGMLSGQIKKITSFINPQNIFGADVISRINYCQTHENGLKELQQIITRVINTELETFSIHENITRNDFEKVIIVGNTTMLHILLGENPISIAMAPFKPKFTDKQTRKGDTTGLHINSNARVITLPCISAFVGADILAGLAALKVSLKNYLFLDIGTNGEIALVKGEKIFTCATAAGPAFEGANISWGMGAVSGAISGFTDKENYQVIGNTYPRGICGSGIVDIVAYLMSNDLIDETGLMQDTFVIHQENNIQITQKDIREIQLAKSAILSGIKILLKQAGLSYQDIDALFLAGGFGHNINIKSALQIGLLPYELQDKIYPVGNSAGIGALQYLKSDAFKKKTCKIVNNSHYIELSNIDEFTMEFALNMDFIKNSF